MTDTSKLHRRDFLRISAITAVSTVLAACGGLTGSTTPKPKTGGSQTSQATGSAPTKPAPEGSTSAGGPSAQPTQATRGGTPVAPKATGTTTTDVKYAQGLTYNGKLHESPQLAQMVKSGKLPSVDKRLPEHPYVVPHKWLKQGKYGGTMRWICTDSSDWSTTHLVQESMYGHSPLRWLHDGLEIGPGMAESWEANDDLSVWTFHFRKGLRWSDGHPWTVDDILFWWEDEVKVPELNQYVPQELTSGTGHPVDMRKVDDYALELRYDSATPLAADYAAAWVKRGEGPQWMDPKHYLKQFHIKYNPKLDKKKWVSDFQAKLDWATNPDNPTMTGWMLSKYVKGQYSIWERNPYYYCIDKWGNQLPFIDTLIMTNVTDPQVMRLNIQQGKADYALGALIGLGLSDVSTFKQSQSTSNMNVIYWDSGSGTGSGYYFNYDYKDDNMRKLIREPKFRQALSLAFNREQVRKAIYFNQAEVSTGTMSPKAIEYQIGNGPRVYKQWRDSWVGYDPAKAKQMLDELGLKDTNGDGWREMPDGSPLKVALVYDASISSTSDDVRIDTLLASDWQSIGINAKLSPVTSTGLTDRWAAGELMTRADFGGTEVSDGPNCLVYPQWLISNDSNHWAPLEGQWFYLQGTAKAKQELNVDPWKRHPPRLEPTKGGPIDRLWGIYRKTRTEPDFMKRTQAVWELMKIHIQEGPFFTGAVGNYPVVVLVKQGLMNVPRREDLTQHGFTNPWVVPSPAVYDPENWYWDNPGQHS